MSTKVIGPPTLSENEELAPETIVALRSIAFERGITPCHQKDCVYIATHTAEWIDRKQLSMCEPHARWVQFIGKTMGFPVPITVLPRPDAPSKRFQAIGKDIANEPDEE